MVADCLLHVRPGDGPTHHMRCFGGVHPAYRGRGIGSRLLAWAEYAAVPLHEERFGERPLTLEFECQAANRTALDMFAHHGYREARRFHTMVCDLSVPPPDCPVPGGIAIVGFTPERSADALLIRNEAFRDHWGSTATSAERWEHQIGSAAFRPRYSLLGYGGEEPLGMVTCNEYDSATAATGWRDLYIGLVATRRSERKRGIASALLSRVLAAARADGFATASLGVDADSLTGAVSLYQKLGFAVTRTRVTLTRSLR